MLFSMLSVCHGVLGIPVGIFVHSTFKVHDIGNFSNHYND